ncbi:MAG TPA: hypothetical protein VMU44_07225 [Steroidobacteraceae bacterium]|nr:hypothetical protein [Steroidobacteraceae bacterium]
MKKRIALLLLAFVMPTGIALATTPLANPTKLPKVSCDTFHYSDAFLARFPMAPAACREGRVLDGREWARFDTRVYLIDYPQFITVRMLDVRGNPVSTFSFHPAPNARIVMNGRSIPFSQVKLGDTITFWKSEQRLDRRLMPPETAVAWQVMPPLHSVASVG